MIKAILAAAGVLAIISTGAMAEMDGGTTTKIIRHHPDGTHSKTVVRRHVNRYGDLVTKKKTFTEGVGSSTITRSRTIDPAAGGTTTVTRKTIVH